MRSKKPLGSGENSRVKLTRMLLNEGACKHPCQKKVTRPYTLVHNEKIHLRAIMPTGG